MPASSSASSSRRRRRAGIVGINVTPMVDVVLVLLVIMMVSATYIVSRALQVELPKSSSADETAARAPLTITLTRDHRLFIDEDVLAGDAALVERLKAAAAGGDASVIIRADGDVLHREVVHVIDLVRQQGITKLGINVAEE